MKQKKALSTTPVQSEDIDDYFKRIQKLIICSIIFN